MLNGLDLFSGIGGLSLALSPWVRTIAYCEIDRYAQAVLLQRMRDGSLSQAPIWDDITTLLPEMLPGSVDIIFGGFPCQDISVAGHGVGLEGKRSGLFSEILRLAQEIKPTFLFLENVSAITGRGLETVIREITEIGYDCRWSCLSAAEVGANHRRDRWWLLAYSNSEKLRNEPRRSCGEGGKNKNVFGDNGKKEYVSYSMCERLEGQREKSVEFHEKQSNTFNRSWWTTEPNVGRVVNGLPFRMERLKCLGNSVVPLCAREAFKELIGIL